MVLDVYTSVLLFLIIGYCGSLVATVTGLPRVVPMILLGLAISPVIHPTITTEPTCIITANTTDCPAFPGVAHINDAGGPVNPGTAIKTIALLIALARGGLSLRVSVFRDIAIPSLLLATIPYGMELVVLAVSARALLPASTGFEGTLGLPTFFAASGWAPLSPSIVIPNMLHFVEDLGLTEAGNFVLLGCPLEVSTALITEGILSGVFLTPESKVLVLGHIPLYIIGTILYGFAFAFGFYLYKRFRAVPFVLKHMGAPYQFEDMGVFMFVFILCYTTSIDGINTPWLVGFFAALCCGIGTQFLIPEVADRVLAQLKPVWTIAEYFLFPLTGCIIRPAIDAGLGNSLFGEFFAVLILGQLGRLGGNVIVGLVWHGTKCRRAPWAWTGQDWKEAFARVVFAWTTTMPKATMQATLGPKIALGFSKQSRTLMSTDPELAQRYAEASEFIGAAAAVAILYMATFGSMLTKTVGMAIAKYFQRKVKAKEEQPVNPQLETIQAEAAGESSNSSDGVSKGPVQSDTTISA
jgi:hypothetical protein